MSTSNLLLRITALLWVIWGLVHVFAGILTMSFDTSSAAAGIADAVDPTLLEMNYHGAVGAIINQHGFNLLWIGLATTVCSWYIWRASGAALFLAALVGGLADVGYFIFLDIGGFVNFVPGNVMTLVSGTAIILSLAFYRSQRAKPA